MFCHGQLSMLKPAASDLTSFYLCISLGGAFGGKLVGLAAPALFVDFFELNASIAACLVLSLRFLYGYRSKVLLLVSAVVAIVCLRVAGDLDLDSALRTFQGRNFYGALSVREHRDAAGNRIRVLVHGRIVHGSQLLDGPTGSSQPAITGANPALASRSPGRLPVSMLESLVWARER